MLEFTPYTFDENYRQKWQVHLNDYIVLTRNGERVGNSVYRIGGLGKPNRQNPYFVLIKQVESKYSNEILTLASNHISGVKPNPNYLAGHWCILDWDGNELVEFDPFKIPYLVINSCIYSLGDGYYNIKTGYCYTQCASESIQTKKSLILELGINGNAIQIDKQTGEWFEIP